MKKTKKRPPVRRCYGCGCEEERACLVRGLDGYMPCSWAGPNLCSACVDSLTFAGLAQWNARRSDRVFPECGEWTCADWGNALAGEVGELCNKIKKHRRDGNVPIEEIAKELADVVIYADHVARYFGINLGEAVRAKFNEVSQMRHSEIRL